MFYWGYQAQLAELFLAAPIKIGMTFADAFFWLVGASQVVVSIGFVLLIRKVKTKQRTPEHFVLARGQYQDGLLSAATLWAVLLSKDSALASGSINLLGALVLLWLLARTVRRVRCLRRLD